MTSIHQDIRSVLVSAEEITEIARRIGGEINLAYRDSNRPLVLVVILKGSMMFASELMKYIELPVELDFMKVSSYGSGTKSSGLINIQLDLSRKEISDSDLLIVEDIVDSGRTLSRLTELFRQRGVHSVRTVAMLDKPSRREVRFVPDYVGCKIPDEFVVGFGLDYDEKYRNLPYVGVLKPEIYNN